MYNFVQRVFVGKATGSASTQTAGSQLNPAAMTVGDLYLVSEDGIILNAASAATSKTARVVRGTAPGKSISSSLIKSGTGNGTKYTYQEYTAPVAQVTVFADLGLVPFTDYKLEVIVQQDLPLISNRQDRIEVYHTTGATVGVLDYQAIVRKFNKQRSGMQGIIVASTTGTTNLTLTGQPVLGSAIDDYSFVRFDSAFVTYSFYNATSGLKTTLNSPTAIQPTTVTAAVGGSGVAVQVRAMERISLGNFGFTDPRATWYKGSFPFGAVDGVGYDIFNVQQLLRGEYQFQDDKAYPHSTVIAIVTGNTQSSGFKAILDAFIGQAATGAPAGE